MARWTAIGAIAAISALCTLAVRTTILASGHHDATEASARRVAVEFFRSQNDRQYDRTCRLLSHGFYTSHRLPDPQTCVALLRIGFLFSGRIQFRILGVERHGTGFVVRALADGAPGRMILVRENGNLRILSVRSK
jgi:hypothetical protein